MKAGRAWLVAILAGTITLGFPAANAFAGEYFCPALADGNGANNALSRVINGNGGTGGDGENGTGGNGSDGVGRNGADANGSDGRDGSDGGTGGNGGTGIGGDRGNGIGGDGGDANGGNGVPGTDGAFATGSGSGSGFGHLISEHVALPDVISMVVGD